MSKFVHIVTLLSLLFLADRSTFAQVDPVTVLPGTWAGWFEAIYSSQGGDAGRTLIIESVTPKEEKGWIAKSRFGTTGGKLFNNAIDVSRDGDDIILKWIFGTQRSPVRVKLVGTNKLEGYYITWRLGGSSNTKMKASFEKK